MIFFGNISPTILQNWLIIFHAQSQLTAIRVHIANLNTGSIWSSFAIIGTIKHTKKTLIKTKVIQNVTSFPKDKLVLSFF